MPSATATEGDASARRTAILDTPTTSFPVRTDMESFLLIEGPPV
jgi:hypothetical protein